MCVYQSKNQIRVRVCCVSISNISNIPHIFSLSSVFQQQIKKIFGADRWHLRVMMMRCEKRCEVKIESRIFTMFGHCQDVTVLEHLC